jgi:Fic family protein
MDKAHFSSTAPGDLVPISGTDPLFGEWSHSAFIPHALPIESPDLSGATYRMVANARAALAALDSTATRLPNPSLFRRPSLQAEAQSTSALEGTYAPLSEVLIVDEERPPNADMKEIVNYVQMGNFAFHSIEQGAGLTVGFLENLQQTLVSGTSGESASSGSVRDHQVVIGRRKDAAPATPPVYAARFIPSPPGLDLRARVQDLLDWMTNPEVESNIDPVVAAAMAHYQFETLHPFHDGNGRIGRLLIVVHLLTQRVLSEPTLTVSPWFEARREEYYDNLFSVSCTGDWDSYIGYFATGLAASANSTRNRMLKLVEVQEELKSIVRGSALRADTAHKLVDYAVANTVFTVRAVERDLDISYGRANGLVTQLIELNILKTLGASTVGRRFYSPAVLAAVVSIQN